MSGHVALKLRLAARDLERLADQPRPHRWAPVSTELRDLARTLDDVRADVERAARIAHRTPTVDRARDALVHLLADQAEETR